MSSTPMWASGLCGLLLTLVGSAASAHPGQILRVAHGTKAFIEPHLLTVQYQIKLPLNHMHGSNPVISEDHVLDGWLVELDGRYTPWSHTSKIRILQKQRSLEAEVILKAPLGPHTREIRLSNGNFLDTPGFFSNELFLDHSFQLDNTRPPARRNAGQKANLAGVWTPDPESREWLIQVQHKPSFTKNIEIWATARSPLVRADAPNEPKLLTAWHQNRTTPLLSALICALGACLSFAMSLAAPPKPKQELWFFFATLSAITITWALPGGLRSFPYVSLFFFVAMGLCATWKTTAWYAPIIASLGLALAYGAPRLALPSLTICLLVGGFHLRYTSTKGPTSRYLLGSLSILLMVITLWRMI